MIGVSKKLFWMTALLSALFCLAACQPEAEGGGGQNPPQDPPPLLPQGVHVKGDLISFLTSEAEPAEPYTIEPELNPGQSVKSWTSSAPAVATVEDTDGNGLVSPVGPGITEITMTLISNDTVTWTVGVVRADPPNPKSLVQKFGVTMTGISAVIVKETLKRLHHYLETLDLETLDKEEVDSALKAAVKHGDELNLPSFNIPAGFGYGSASGGVKLLVVGINSFAGKNGNGNTPHIVLHFENVVNANIKGGINTDKTNKGGYKESRVRQYLNQTFLPAIKTTGVEEYLWAPKRYVSNAAFGPSAALDLIEDSLWLPTEWELFGERFDSSPLETAENQGRLEYYDLTPDPTDDPTYNTRKKTYGAGISWWMASPTATNGSTENFCSVQSSGGSFTYGSAANSAFLFIIPAFCVR